MFYKKQFKNIKDALTRLIDRMCSVEKMNGHLLTSNSNLNDRVANLEMQLAEEILKNTNEESYLELRALYDDHILKKYQYIDALNKRIGRDEDEEN